MVSFSVVVCIILLLCTALHGIVLCGCVQYTVIMHCSSWYRSLWVCAIYCYYVLLFIVSFSVGVCNILLLCTALHCIVLCGCVQYTVIMYSSSWYRSLWVWSICCYYVLVFIVLFSVGVCNILLLCTALHGIVLCGCVQYTVIMHSFSLVSFSVCVCNILLLCTTLHCIVLCGCVQYTVIMYCSSWYCSLLVCAIYCYYILLFMVSFSVGVCNILLLCTALHGIVLCGCVQYTVIIYCSSWCRSLWVCAIYCYYVLLFMVLFSVCVCNILLLCTALHGIVLCGRVHYTVIMYCSSWYHSLWVCAIYCYYALLFMVSFSVGVCNILLLCTALHCIVLCGCVQYTVIMYCSSLYCSMWVCAIYCYYVQLFMVSFSVGVVNMLLLCTGLHCIVLCGCVQYTVIMYCSSWYRSLWVCAIYCYYAQLFISIVLCVCLQYTVIMYCSSLYRSLWVCAIYCCYVLLFMVSFSVGVCNILLLCTALHGIVLCGCVQYTVIMHSFSLV